MSRKKGGRTNHGQNGQTDLHQRPTYHDSVQPYDWGACLPVGEADAFAGFVISIFQIGFSGGADGDDVTFSWNR